MANDKVITTDALIAKFQYALDNDWGYIYGTAGELWTLEKQNAATRKQTIEYGRQWIGHRVSDCSGLFYWAFKQLGGYMYHGSNTMYKSYCKAKGQLKNGKKANGEALLPGTAVFTGTESDHGHVGLYIGGGYVIEAQGTKAGVIKTKVTLSKWTYWGELKGVEYGTAPADTVQPDPEPADDKEVRPTLRKGSKGTWVTLLQTELINKGYSCGATGADGDFGTNTEKAVKAFQREHDGPDGRALTVDGVVGPATWWALESTPERVTYTVTIKNLTAEQKDKLLKEYQGATSTPEN